jgi:hypothetical protein
MRPALRSKAIAEDIVTPRMLSYIGCHPIVRVNPVDVAAERLLTEKKTV